MSLPEAIPFPARCSAACLLCMVLLCAPSVRGQQAQVRLTIFEATCVGGPHQLALVRVATTLKDTTNAAAVCFVTVPKLGRESESSDGYSFCTYHFGEVRKRDRTDGTEFGKTLRDYNDTSLQSWFDQPGCSFPMPNIAGLLSEVMKTSDRDTPLQALLDPLHDRDLLSENEVRHLASDWKDTITGEALDDSYQKGFARDVHAALDTTFSDMEPLTSDEVATNEELSLLDSMVFDLKAEIAQMQGLVDEMGERTDVAPKYVWKDDAEALLKQIQPLQGRVQGLRPVIKELQGKTTRYTWLSKRTSGIAAELEQAEESTTRLAEAVESWIHRIDIDTNFVLLCLALLLLLVLLYGLWRLQGRMVARLDRMSKRLDEEKLLLDDLKTISRPSRTTTFEPVAELERILSAHRFPEGQNGSSTLQAEPAADPSQPPSASGDPDAGTQNGSAATASTRESRPEARAQIRSFLARLFLRFSTQQNDGSQIDWATKYRDLYAEIDRYKDDLNDQLIAWLANGQHADERVDAPVDTAAQREIIEAKAILAVLFNINKEDVSFVKGVRALESKIEMLETKVKNRDTVVRIFWPDDAARATPETWKTIKRRASGANQLTNSLGKVLQCEGQAPKVVREAANALFIDLHEMGKAHLDLLSQGQPLSMPRLVKEIRKKLDADKQALEEYARLKDAEQRVRDTLSKYTDGSNDDLEHMAKELDKELDAALREIKLHAIPARPGEPSNNAGGFGEGGVSEGHKAVEDTKKPSRSISWQVHQLVHHHTWIKEVGEKLVAALSRYLNMPDGAVFDDLMGEPDLLKQIGHEQEEHQQLRLKLSAALIALKRDRERAREAGQNDVILLLQMKEIEKGLLSLLHTMGNFPGEKLWTSGIFNGFSEGWLHRLFRADLVLETYFSTEHPLYQAVHEASDALREAMDAFDVELSPIALLDPAPEDARKDYNADSTLYGLQEVKQKISERSHSALEQGNFIVDIRAFPFKSPQNQGEADVVMVNPHEWY